MLFSANHGLQPVPAMVTCSGFNPAASPPVYHAAWPLQLFMWADDFSVICGEWQGQRHGQEKFGLPRGKTGTEPACSSHNWDRRAHANGSRKQKAPVSPNLVRFTPLVQFRNGLNGS